jgi:hypothetical protein
VTNSIATSASAAPESFFTANDPKFGFAIGLLANILQVGALLVEASDEWRSFLFLTSLLASVALILWIRHKWPTSRANMWAFASATLLTVGLFVGGSVIRGEAAQSHVVPPPPPISYYVRLSAYAYDATDGALDLDQQLTDVQISIVDQFKHSVSYKTRRAGALAVMQTWGPILVGACGLYHVRFLERENDTEAKALVVRIGIDASRLSICRQ